MPVEPEHRSILAVDIEAFGDRARTDPIRLRLHRFLIRAVDALIAQARITDDQHATTGTGDGLLISFVPQVSTVGLLDSLIPRLARRLEGFNSGRTPPERMRLRVAVHAGAVLADPAPLHGEAIILAFRLLDSSSLRACLKATERPVAVIASQSIYHAVVKHAYGRIDPTAWHPVVAQAKETDELAWVHVPGDSDAPRRAGVVLHAWASSPNRYKGRLRTDSLFEIVDRFLDLDSIADEQGRKQIVSLLPKQIANAVPYHVVGRAHVLGIVRTCLNYPDGFDELVTVVRRFEGNSLSMRRLDEAISRALVQPSS